MKHKLKVVFGHEQTLKIYNNESLTQEEIGINVREYIFDTAIEKTAFINGLNEAIGWTRFCIPDEEIGRRSVL